MCVCKSLKFTTPDKPNMANSDDSNSTKCFSAILCRLLCSGSHPTHPSNQFDTKKIEYQNPEKSHKTDADVKLTEASFSTPGVVARLMGLESFPNTPLAQKDRTLGSYFRSRSVNSIDFLSHFNPIIKKGHHHYHHRRVRTSVSFREGINDDYNSANVVVHLEEVHDETAEDKEDVMLVRRRPNVDYQKGRKEKVVATSRNSKILQEKKVAERPSKKIEMEEKRRFVCVKSSSGGGYATTSKRDFNGKARWRMKQTRPVIKAVNSKEELMGSKCVKRKKNKILAHKTLSGCSSLKKVHPEAIVPDQGGGEVCSGKHLPCQIANSDSPHSSDPHSDINGEARAIIKGRNERKNMKNKESCNYKRVVEEIYRLTEEDVNSSWIRGLVLSFEDFEDICQQFGQDILEVLLKQFVDELLLLYGTRRIKY